MQLKNDVLSINNKETSLIMSYRPYSKKIAMIVMDVLWIMMVMKQMLPAYLRCWYNDCNELFWQQQ
jgi:hypothetical protein